MGLISNIPAFLNRPFDLENRSLATHPTKNPSSFDLLTKLADTAACVEEMKKALPSFDGMSDVDRYLRLFLAENPQEKMIHTWISDFLTFSQDENQKITQFDRVVNPLDFKNAFAVLTAVFRLFLLMENQEKSLPNVSERVIAYCEYMIMAVGARLEKLIDEHPDYQMLDLTDLSPAAKIFQLNFSSLPTQLFNELMEQRLQSERSKTAAWIKQTRFTLLMSMGILVAGTAYTVKKWMEVSSPPPSLMAINHISDPLYAVIGTLALGIIGGCSVFISRHMESKRDPQGEISIKNAKAKKKRYQVEGKISKIDRKIYLEQKHKFFLEELKLMQEHCLSLEEIFQKPPIIQEANPILVKVTLIKNKIRELAAADTIENDAIEKIKKSFLRVLEDSKQFFQEAKMSPADRKVMQDIRDVLTGKQKPLGTPRKWIKGFAS